MAVIALMADWELASQGQTIFAIRYLSGITRLADISSGEVVPGEYSMANQTRFLPGYLVPG